MRTREEIEAKMAEERQAKRQEAIQRIAAKHNLTVEIVNDILNLKDKKAADITSTFGNDTDYNFSGTLGGKPFASICEHRPDPKWPGRDTYHYKVTLDGASFDDKRAERLHEKIYRLRNECFREFHRIGSEIQYNSIWAIELRHLERMKELEEAEQKRQARIVANTLLDDLVK